VQLQVELVELGGHLSLNDGVVKQLEHLFPLDLAGVVGESERGRHRAGFVAINAQNAHQLAFNDLTNFLATIQGAVLQLELARLINHNGPGCDKLAILIEAQYVVAIDWCGGWIGRVLRCFAKVRIFMRPEAFEPFRRFFFWLFKNIGGRRS
jgi:hypothetical protein